MKKKDTVLIGVRIKAKAGEPFQGLTPDVWTLDELNAIAPEKRETGQFATAVQEIAGSLYYTWYIIDNDLAWRAYLNNAATIDHPTGGDPTAHGKTTSFTSLSIEDVDYHQKTGIYLPALTNEEIQNIPASELRGGMGLVNITTKRIEFVYNFLTPTRIRWASLGTI